MSAELLMPERELNALDRCDRCGAQAYVLVTVNGGFELLFCGHHWREHEDKLKETAVRIVDETKKLSPEGVQTESDGVR